MKNRLIWMKIAKLELEFWNWVVMRLVARFRGRIGGAFQSI